MQVAIMGSVGVGGAGRFGGLGIPSKSLNLVAGSHRYLSMSAADFGSFDRGKFAFSTWVKRASLTGAVMSVFGKQATVSVAPFELFFGASNEIVFQTSGNGSSTDGRIVTTAGFNSTSNWYHILLHFDRANATSGDRIRLWVDGSEISSFSTDTAPSSDVQNNAGAVEVGSSYSGSGLEFDGLIYQPAFFSGSLPSIGSVYNAGSKVDISGLLGIKSELDVSGGIVTSDAFLAPDWTNNNGVTASATTP